MIESLPAFPIQGNLFGWIGMNIGHAFWEDTDNHNLFPKEMGLQDLEFSNLRNSLHSSTFLPKLFPRYLIVQVSKICKSNQRKKIPWNLFSPKKFTVVNVKIFPCGFPLSIGRTRFGCYCKDWARISIYEHEIKQLLLKATSCLWLPHNITQLIHLQNFILAKWNSKHFRTF